MWITHLLEAVTIPNTVLLPSVPSVKPWPDSGIIQSSNLKLARERVNHFLCTNFKLAKVCQLGRPFADRRMASLAFSGAMIISADALSQEAASFKLGETNLTPAVRVDYVSIDNVYRKASDEVSGTGVHVKPELVWSADRRLLTFDALYSGDYASFSEDGLDYDNHYLRLRGIGDISSRQRFLASLSVTNFAEEQGTGQASGVLDVLDEQVEVTGVFGRAEYTYGARNSRGNLTGGVILGSLSYSNLEAFTDGDDYTFVRPYGVFSLRLSPDTRFLTELRFTAFDYDDDARDRDEVALLTGVEMSASSKLSGDARIGVAKASFDQDSDNDTTELIAEVGLQYSPVSYSRFDISFDRSFETEDNNVDNIGRAIDDTAGIVWTHDWSSRFQTRTTLSLDNSDRECPNVDDQTVAFEIELNYQVRRWLQFGISGTQESRSITDCVDTPAVLEALDYDRSVVGAHVRATL